MGLLDQAVEAATATKASQEAAIINADRERGQRFATELTEDFGIEGIEWLDRIKGRRYQRKYRDYGGHQWVEQIQTVDRFQVEDVVLGVILHSSSYSTSRVGSDFAIWHTCPTCGEKRMYPLRHVSTYGSAPKDIAKHKAELIQAIGMVITANAQCTHCQARPCSECGKPY